MSPNRMSPNRMSPNTYAFPRLVRGTLKNGRPGTVGTITLAMVLNAVVLNAIMGAGKNYVTEGDLHTASRANALFGLTAEFNGVFLVLAVCICAMLVFTSLGAVYQSRKQAVSVMRLCGLSLKKTVALHVWEALVMSAVAALIAAVLFVPLSWLYNACLPLLGLAPEGLPLGIHVAALVVSAGGVALFVLVIAATKPRGVYRFGGTDQRRGHGRLTRAFVLVAMAVAGFFLFVPASPVADDTRMILVLPWSAVFLLLYGTKLITVVCRLATVRIRRTGAAPRRGISIARLETSMTSRVNPILALTVVLAFVIPLSAVMATGRSASVVDVYRAVNAQTIADSNQALSPEELSRLNSEDSESLYVATSTDVYRGDDPYAAEQPLLGMMDLTKLSAFFPEVQLLSGDLESVQGGTVAVTDESKQVGDSVTILAGDGSSCELTVGAVVTLPSVIGFDYVSSDARPACSAASFGWAMAYSQRSAASLSSVLSDSGWTIEEKNQWLADGAAETVANQRTALVTMFIVPLMMALFVTAVSMKSRKEVVRESNRVLAHVGATRRDFRRIGAIEGLVAGGAALLLLALAVVLNFIVLGPVAADSGVGLTFDYQLDAIFLALTLVIVVGIHTATAFGRTRMQ